MAFAEEDEVTQALAFYGLHKSFSVRIAVWALCRDLDAFDATATQDSRKVFSENRVTIVNQVRRPAQEPVVSENLSRPFRPPPGGNRVKRRSRLGEDC